MALAKITLKLGKKTIELTEEQFEELKQDMRQLDQSHHYYWHNYRDWGYPNRYPYGSTPWITYTTCGNSITANTGGKPQSITASPPDFTGSVVSYNA